MSFTLWTIFMVVLVIGAFIVSRRARPQEDRAEDIAAEALPQIGGIAERQHARRFGRPPTDTPGPPGLSIWYPEPRKKRARHA